MKNHVDELKLARQVAGTEFDTFDHIAPNNQQSETDAEEEGSIKSR